MILFQYTKFLINGGLIGVLAWALQAILFQVVFSEHGGMAYALASLITYIPLLVLNFMLQKAFIFVSEGRFRRFLIANIGIMLFVSALSPVCRQILHPLVGEELGDNGGFILAALIGATPSFLLSRYFVFAGKRVGQA